MRGINSKGFALLEGLALTIALGLVLGVGYYVYDSHKKADDNLVSAPAQDTSDKSKSENQKYLEIRELGIKLPLTDDLGDLRYEHHGDTEGLYSLYLPAIAGTYSKNCPIEPAFNLPLYVVSKHDGTYQEESSDEVGPGRVPAKLLKQFEGFYVQETPSAAQDSGEECAPGFNAARNNLKQAFQKAKSI